MDKLVPRWGGTYESQEAHIRKSLADLHASNGRQVTDLLGGQVEQARRTMGNVLDWLRQVADKNDQIILQINSNMRA